MSIFSIGVSGLNAAQIALATAGKNITNVYTPGYNREITLLGEGLAGNGVEVKNIQRQFNQFVASQYNSALSGQTALNVYQTQISQIDNLLADSKAGLAPLMQSFFSSLQDLAASPSDPAARQGLIGTADTLSGQFRAFDSYLNDLQKNVNGQIGDVVFQVNNLAEQMANLNREITLAKARTGQAPNDLLNQRDHTVTELSKLIDVELTIQDGGTYNLSIGNGQQLVAGERSFSLQAMASSSDPSRIVVGFKDGAGNVREMNEASFTGGELGGLMTFRRETLDKTQNQLGQMAVSFALVFNQQHTQGVDINGDAGKAMFGIGSPTAYANRNNAVGGAQINQTQYTDGSQLLATDYTLRVTGVDAGGNPTFRAIRKDSGQALDPAPVFDSADGSVSFGGMKLSFDGAAFNESDSYEIQPVRRGAGQITNEIHDTGLIAAGEAGGGTGDNRNALALQNLQQAKLVGGNATLSQAYASLVGDVGNRANVVAANAKAQDGLAEQLGALQQGTSGVNLDEEAANLLRFQQYYQASAKIIEVGASVLDTILGINR